MRQLIPRISFVTETSELLVANKVEGTVSTASHLPYWSVYSLLQRDLHATTLVPLSGLHASYCEKTPVSMFAAIPAIQCTSSVRCQSTAWKWNTMSGQLAKATHLVGLTYPCTRRVGPETSGQPGHSPCQTR